jgi:hypothetical protein
MSELKIPNIFADETTRKKFCALYEECLDSLLELFPECNDLREELEIHRTTIKDHTAKEDEFIRTWHQQMIPLYTLADKHDLEFWNKDVSYLGKIHLKDKISDAGFTKESLQVLWEYIDGLNKHSRVYNAIPDKMINQLQNFTMDYIGKIQRGELKFDLDNWNDIQHLGKSVMQAINPEDLSQFTDNMTGLINSYNINSMEDAFKFIGDMPGINSLNIPRNLANIFENICKRENP